MAIEIHDIESEEQWHALRKQDVTASVAGALLGIHPYVTAYGLAAEKLGLITPEPPSPGILRRGNLLEPVALQILQEDYPTERFTRPRKYWRDSVTRRGATPDILSEHPERGLGVIQVKSVSPIVFKQKWAAKDDYEGEVEVPLWIAIQALQEADLVGAKWAEVAVIVVDHEIRFFRVPIPFKPQISKKMIEHVAAFWRVVDSGQLPDPDYGRDWKLVSEVMAQGSQDPPPEVRELYGDNRLPELLARREVLKAEIKAAETELKDIDGEIKVKLANADAGILEGWQITNKETHRKGYTVEPTSYRQLRVKRI